MGATSGIQESPPDDHQADGRALAFYERANSATQPPIPAVNSANTPAHAELKRRSTDGHPVHRSKKVKQWVESHTEQIELQFLPGYAPELNPTELLNQDVKTNALGRRRPHTQDELIGDTRSYLRSRQRTPRIVANYFEEKQVSYAKAA
jgi:transposase